MKVLVIPDVHLKYWLFDRAAEILVLGKADMAVCLGDMADDWDCEMLTELYRETFDRAVDFAEKHPETLWCLGNHEVSYIIGKLESGYSPYAESTVIAKVNELKKTLQSSKQMAYMHRIDKIIFSHGGLSEDYISEYLGEEMLNEDVDEIIKAVNNASDRCIWNDDSPLWFRPQLRKVYKPFRPDKYIQVVGHTPVEKVYKENSIVSTDVFSTYRNGKQIGESVMIVIDSISGCYEKIKVAKKDKIAL